MSVKIQYLHQSIAQSVSDHDIDTIFGLVGDANLFMANHFESQPKYPLKWHLLQDLALS